MLAFFVVLFASLAFVVNAVIAVAALRVIFNPKTSDTVRLSALKLITFAQRFLAWIFVFGLFGLASKSGILPSISIPTPWVSSSIERPHAEPQHFFESGQTRTPHRFSPCIQMLGRCGSVKGPMGAS